LITTSHISCHTFPGRHFVSIDVYSCIEDGFDKDFIVNYFKKAFSLQDTEVNYLTRGTRFPVKELE
jgi:S-adenosylmethionine/arginine decarboxylase-like enzyme